MKLNVLLSASVLYIAAVSSAAAATFSVDFGSFGEGLYSDPIIVSEFLTISSGSPFGIGSDGTLVKFGGPPVVFTFDTSKVDVSNVSVSGFSNNSFVTIDAFGSTNTTTIVTSRSWSEVSLISGIGNISQVDVKLSESAITAFEFEYTVVSAVPVPAAVWLFGSGFLCLVGMAKRKTA